MLTRFFLVSRKTLFPLVNWFLLPFPRYSADWCPLIAFSFLLKHDHIHTASRQEFLQHYHFIVTLMDFWVIYRTRLVQLSVLTYKRTWKEIARFWTEETLIKTMNTATTNPLVPCCTKVQAINSTLTADPMMTIGFFYRMATAQVGEAAATGQRQRGPWRWRWSGQHGPQPARRPRPAAQKEGTRRSLRRQEGTCAVFSNRLSFVSSNKKENPILGLGFPWFIPLIKTEVCFKRVIPNGIN